MTKFGASDTNPIMLTRTAHLRYPINIIDSSSQAYHTQFTSLFIVTLSCLGSQLRLPCEGVNTIFNYDFVLNCVHSDLTVLLEFLGYSTELG